MLVLTTEGFVHVIHIGRGELQTRVNEAISRALRIALPSS